MEEERIRERVSTDELEGSASLGEEFKLDSKNQRTLVEVNKGHR